MTMEAIYSIQKNNTGVTSICSINESNDISINDESFIHKYYTPFFSEITMKMYILDQNMIQRNESFLVI